MHSSRPTARTKRFSTTAASQVRTFAGVGFSITCCNCVSARHCAPTQFCYNSHVRPPPKDPKHSTPHEDFELPPPCAAGASPARRDTRRGPAEERRGDGGTDVQERRARIGRPASG